MRLILLLILFLVFACLANAQVKTNFNNREPVTARGKFSKDFRGESPYIIPARDINALLDRDALENASGEPKPFKIAEAIEVDIDVVKDADWVEDDEFAYGKFSVVAVGAKSISANFDLFSLPKGTELYVYSENGEMITGPITEEENNNKNFWGTWVYKGGRLTVDLKVPVESISSLKLHISSMAYGYKELYVDDFGESAACNINVLCPEGNGWANERNSVALILNGNSTAICSGAMINNTCDLSIPYFLTADHCFDNDEDNWKFTFQAWSAACDPSQDAAGVTFNGSTLRARNGASDFCLVELNQMPPANSGITFSGWSRTNAASPAGASITHPRGDVMKIATYDEATTQQTFLGVNTWRADWESGTVEPGSSGGPLYNNNHQIIGQLTGGNPSDICTANDHAFFGRFDLSWTGGGTNATRLSNWLDPDGTDAIAIDTRGIPFVTETSFVCNANTTFTLSNPPAGAAITWSATPSNLFATTAGATTSGSGTTAVVRAANASTSGAGVITFSIQGDCDPVPVVQSVWVGTRAPTGFVSVVVDPWMKRILAMVNSVPDATGYEWYINGSLFTGQNMNSNYVQMPISGSCAIQGYTVGVKAINECGTSTMYSEYHANPCYEGGFFYSYYPNPASETLSIERNYQYNTESNHGNLYPSNKIQSTYYYRFYDFNNGLIVLEGNLSTKTEIDVSKLSKGKYVLKIQVDKDNEETHHIIID